jgi:hypothetical protein
VLLLVLRACHSSHFFCSARCTPRRKQSSTCLCVSLALKTAHKTP